MLPTTSFAALLLIALIPGYAYLRLTEDARRPRDNSTLDELLEVLTVGLGTTGLALGTFIVLWPHAFGEVLNKASLTQPDELRHAVIICGVVAGLAVVIACLGAWGTLIAGRGSYSPNVWRSTLGLRRKQHIPYVILDLKDDEKRIEGVLHSYTTLDGDHPRDISLMSPKISRAGSTWEAGADFVVISAEQIEKIWFKLTVDPGHPK